MQAYQQSVAATAELVDLLGALDGLDAGSLPGRCQRAANLLESSYSHVIALKNQLTNQT